jgi:hypothetical protein
MRTMQMIVHTFKKDSRHLWLPIAATLVLLMELAREDRWRSSWMASSAEGWLNILLPLAWACLMGMTVEEEPLAGDRQFWITRPHRWPELLAAKALFAMAYIHLPMLLADAWILSMRGFSPWQCIPQLLAKQGLVALAVTLPSIALATLVRDFTHFMLGLFALGAGFIFIGGGSATAPWDSVTLVRHSVAIVFAGIAAGAIVLLQYALRRTAIARVFGVATALAAGALFAYLPSANAWALLCKVSPASGAPKMEMLPPKAGGPKFGIATFVSVPIPIAVTGTDAGALASTSEYLDMEVVAPDGERIRSVSDVRGPGGPMPLFGTLTRDDESSWLLLRFTKSSYEKLRGGLVTIAGHAVLEFHRQGTPISMAEAHCASSRTYAEFGQEMLKVLCESPSDVPRTLVTLRGPETGQEWKQSLGDASTFYRGPRGSWLSPLNRRDTFFHFAEDPKGFGSQWLVPEAAVDKMKIEIRQQPLIGYAAVEFQFEHVRLADYAVTLPR